jgi:hypothetical protein
MADIIARIQNRRGERRELPQPLSQGEIGFTEDTEQIYIGANSQDPNSTVTLTTRLYDSNDIGIANLYIDDHILFIDPPTFNDTFDPNTILADTGADYFCIATRTVLDNPDNAKTVRVVERAYVGYQTAPGSKPGAGLGTETWVGEITQFQNFYLNPLPARGDVADPNVDAFYTGEDIGCISELINTIHGSLGLVNTLDNIEIQRATIRATEAAPTSIRIDAAEKEVLNFDYPPITGLSIDYSLVSETCEYARVGRINVAAASVDAEFNTFFTELQGTTTATLNFRVDTTFAGASNTVSLVAENNNCLDMIMTYRVVRWPSVADDLAPSGPVLAAIEISEDQQVICGVLTQVDVRTFDPQGDEIMDTSTFTFLWEYVSGDPVTISNPGEQVTGLILQAQPATGTVLRVTVTDPFNSVVLSDEVEIVRVPQAETLTIAGEGEVLVGQPGFGGTASSSENERPAALFVTDLILDPSGEPVIQTPPCQTPDPNTEQIFWNWPPDAEFITDPASVNYIGTNVYRVDGDDFVLIEFVPGKDRNYANIPVSPTAYYTVAAVWRPLGLGAPKLYFARDRVLSGQINKQSSVINTSRTCAIGSDRASITVDIGRIGIETVIAQDQSGAPIQATGVFFNDFNLSKVTILPQEQASDTSGAQIQGEGAELTDFFVERLNGINIGGP